MRSFLNASILRYIALFREFAAVGFLILLCLFLYSREPQFLSQENLKDILVQVSAVAIAAAGMTFVILTAGIDLSVGSILALAGCSGALAGNAILSGAPDGGVAVAGGVLSILLVACACGLANGLLITKLHLTPFIATLGIMSIARGLAYVTSNSSPVQVLDGMRVFARARFLELPLPIFLLFGTYLLSWVLLRFTLFGRYLYAIGGNETATRLSGVRVGKYKALAYALSGLFAGLSALIVAGRVGWMAPQEGEGFELDVIAAVVIGGTSLYGGEGSIWGTFLGALIMGVVRNGLNLMGVDYNLQKIVIGSIILIAVTVDVFARRVSVRS
ncbi:MAG: ABC transporter permease [Candidatus Omnitrophica bacterium]|nr:ABC transporter permease [Candidatus Omnitrophota bacterium]